MIASIRGRVVTVTGDAVVVEVGGVGLLVHCVPRVLSRLRIGEEATLVTALVVREDSLTLFGFADSRERDTFETLQTVSGIGPRTAQGVLATLTVDELATAIAAQDLKTLSRPSGIGPRAAGRMALELKDRVLPTVSVVGTPTAAAPAWTEQVVDGLVALGWPARDARAAAVAVAEEVAQQQGPDVAFTSGTAPANDAPQVAALLRAALRHLDRA